VTEDWRNMHNEKLHNLYTSPNIIRATEWRIIEWTCSTHGSDEKCILSNGKKT
jgi:hypothetical protein